MTSIRDVMTSTIKTVGPDQSAQEAARLMQSADTGSIPVCEGERIIGMITDRDIAVRGVAAGKGPDCAVRELMTRDIVSARHDDDLQSVAAMMSKAQVRRLPVLDDNGKLVGMVSLGDLARDSGGESAHTALEGVSSPGGQHEG